MLDPLSVETERIPSKHLDSEWREPETFCNGNGVTFTKLTRRITFCTVESSFKFLVKVKF